MYRRFLLQSTINTIIYIAFTLKYRLQLLDKKHCVVVLGNYLLVDTDGIVGAVLLELNESWLLLGSSCSGLLNDISEL